MAMTPAWVAHREAVVTVLFSEMEDADAQLLMDAMAL